MKVLLTTNAHGVTGGAPRSLIELAAELLGRGVNITVVIPKHSNIEKFLLKSGIPYVCIRQYPDWCCEKTRCRNIQFYIKYYIKRLLNVISLMRLVRLIRNENIDIVHVNELGGYVPGWAGIICKIPVVWHIRDFMEEDLGWTFFNRNRAIKMVNQASQMIAISNEIKAKWERVFSTPINVIYNGLPVDKYYMPKRMTLEEPVKIIIFGRIAPQKGQLFFFDGMKELMDRTGSQIKCYWAGHIDDQNYYEEVEKAIEANGMSEYVSYLGEVSPIQPVLKDMDIVCVCSIREGFGRVTIEGMMAGCCVLGADSGATPEIITNGETGYLYKNGDLTDFVKQLRFMLEHKDETLAVARKGQEYAVHTFSIKHVADNVMQIYSDLLSNRGRGR
ncbi:MAG: glycosyltransferase family 4 protein [Ruminococcus flavefaciens]|nr:glycosyltransferase family 4 protein [Ruminococcus flavefaciens]